MQKAEEKEGTQIRSIMQELTLYVGLPDENTMRGTHNSTNSPRNSKVPCTPHAHPAFNKHQE